MRSLGLLGLDERGDEALEVAEVLHRLHGGDSGLDEFVAAHLGLAAGGDDADGGGHRSTVARVLRFGLGLLRRFDQRLDRLGVLGEPLEGDRQRDLARVDEALVVLVGLHLLADAVRVAGELFGGDLLGGVGLGVLLAHGVLFGG